MSEVVTENPIKAAAKAAFPYSMPMLAGFLFLGIAYGIYMKALGFGVWFPVQWQHSFMRAQWNLLPLPP